MAGDAFYFQTLLQRSHGFGRTRDNALLRTVDGGEKEFVVEPACDVRFGMRDRQHGAAGDFLHQVSPRTHDVDRVLEREDAA